MERDSRKEVDKIKCLSYLGQNSVQGMDSLYEVFFFFQLKYSLFTVFCYFQVYSKVIDI